MLQDFDLQMKFHHYNIFIQNVWYGQQDTVTCVTSAMSNTNCYLDITSTLQNSFNGRNQNSVVLSNNFTGNDPCGGTFKCGRISYSK